MANSTKPASGCLILFGIPFALAGFSFAIVSFRSIGDPKFQNPMVGVIVGSIFALVGTLIIAAGVQVLKGEKRTSAVQTTYPNQPWMWREDWAQSRAMGRGAGATALLWVFAAMWNAISWLSVWAALQHPQPEGKRWVYLVLALFPLIGIGLLIAAIRGTVRRVRFGKTSLQLQAVPVPLGRKLQGSIEAPLPYPLPHGIQMKLSCINRVTSGSGNSESTFDHILWQESKVVTPEQVMAGVNGSAIPVQFDVPRDKPATDNSQSRSQILWLVHAEADVPGADFSDDYEVPVFETRDSPALADWQSKAETEEREHPPSAPIRPTVQISSAPEGGTLFYFPAGKNVSSALGVTFFALIFGGVDSALFYFQAHARVLIVFALFFGIFAFFLTLIALNLWFGTARIVASSSGVSVRTNLLGMGGKKNWSTSEIQDIYPKITMQSGSGGRGVAYYTVTLKNTSGQEVSLGNALRDHNEAEWVCLQIRQMANLQARGRNA